MKKQRAYAFRANEAAAEERDNAIHIYTRALKEPREREAAAGYIDRLIEQYGPVVDGYPSWHPFTRNPKTGRKWNQPETTPQGFVDLDHTIYFRDAFLTAPYGDAKRVIASVLERKDFDIDAEVIDDVVLYNHSTTPVLVTCGGIGKETDGTISKRYALGMMLSTELPAWEEAQYGESWETMQRYILGTPCGSRSSLFVNQETGKALKEVYELLSHHELFGPQR